jgi:hypothetical protein
MKLAVRNILRTTVFFIAVGYVACQRHMMNNVQLRTLAGPLSIPRWYMSEYGAATLLTTNPKWTALSANKGLRTEKPATNRQSYGTALVIS